MLGLLLALSVEVWAPLFVFFDPLFCKLAALDFRENLLHRFLYLRINDAWPSGVVSILRRIAHRIAHVRETALIEQVHDQLQLVHALEISNLGLIAGFDQSFERSLDESGGATAQNALLAEQVAFGFLLERGFDHA